MASIGKALVIGGGFAGTAAALQLRKLGVAVDLVEIDPQWRNYGAGLTLSGATLRALGTLGVLPEVLARAWCADGAAVCTANGTQVAELPTPRVAGPDVPGSGGVMRPVLADILNSATRESGTRVRLGVTFSRIDQDAEAVEVEFSDGNQGRYDLVIGADGLNSKVRAALFPDAPPPSYTGQGVWRAVVARPAEISRPHIFHGQGIKAGVNPVSADEMYLFVTENRASNEHLAEADWPDLLRLTLTGFGGLIGRIRDGLDASSRIVYRPLEALLLPLPWARDRVLLIGDAVHATTPHLASGAGIGIEDAIVLVEELRCAATLAEALAAHQERRWERCRLVAENSLRLGAIEQGHGTQEEHTALMRGSMLALAAPI